MLTTENQQRHHDAVERLANDCDRFARVLDANPGGVTLMAAALELEMTLNRMRHVASAMTREGRAERRVALWFAPEHARAVREQRRLQRAQAKRDDRARKAAAKAMKPLAPTPEKLQRYRWPEPSYVKPAPLVSSVWELGRVSRVKA